jgi:hypothetical protein
MQKDKEHIGLWRALAIQREHEHNREASRLEAQLKELRQELQDRPEKPVIKYIDADKITTAEEEKSRAFRSRLRSFQALAQILALHRERSPGRCQCGQAFLDCRVAQILYSYQAFMGWIDDQLTRLRRHGACDLPDDFPARFDPRWRR